MEMNSVEQAATSKLQNAVREAVQWCLSTRKTNKSKFVRLSNANIYNNLHQTFLVAQKRCRIETLFPVLIDAAEQLLDSGEVVWPVVLTNVDYQSTEVSIETIELHGRATLAQSQAIMFTIKLQDKKLRYPKSITRFLAALNEIRLAMCKVFELSEQDQEKLYHFIYNCSIVIAKEAEAFLELGYARQIVEYLNWCVVSMEGVILLCATKFLPWRVRIYQLICRCYEMLNDTQAAKQAVRRGLDEVDKIRQGELQDPPVPESTLQTLNRLDLLLKQHLFKYEAEINGVNAAITIPTSVQTKKGTPIEESGESDEAKRILEQFGSTTNAITALVLSLIDPSRRLIKTEPPKEDDFERINLIAKIAYELALPSVNTILESLNQTERQTLEEFPLHIHFNLLNWLFNYQFWEMARQMLRAMRIRLTSHTLAAHDHKIFQSFINAGQDPQLYFDSLPFPSSMHFSSWRIMLLQQLELVACVLVLESGVDINKDQVPDPMIDPFESSIFDESVNQTLEANQTEESGNTKQESQDILNKGDYEDDQEKESKETKEDTRSETEENTEESFEVENEQTEVGIIDGKKVNVRYLNRLAMHLRKCCEPSPECSLSLAYYHPDCITDAATLLWNPYCIAMCHEIDQINVETFVNPSLLSLAITCVQAACIAFEKTAIDDVLLRTRAFSRLAWLYNTAKKYKHSIKTLRNLIGYINEFRKLRTFFDLHQPVEESDVIALAKTSFTTQTDKGDDLRSGAGAYAGQGVYGSGSQLHSLEQAINCIYADSLLLLIRSELLYGKIRCQIAARSQAESLHQTNYHSNFLLTSRSRTSIAAKTRKMSQTIPDAESIVTSKKTEIRLIEEFTNNSYARALIAIVFAEFRSSADEREIVFKQAEQYIENAQNNEDALMRLCTEAHSKKRQIKTGLVPPPPIILSRTDSSVTLRPDAWIMRKKNAPEAESKEEKLDETAQVSRPATKNSTLSVAPPKVAYYRVYAKTYGAGTDVSLKCTNYVNTGVPISPTASHITISGLLPNEKYVFAIAAYDEDDELIGDIGKTTTPVETCHPISLQLLRSYLARQAHRFEAFSFAEKYSSMVFRSFAYCIQNALPVWVKSPDQFWHFRRELLVSVPVPIIASAVECIFILVNCSIPVISFDSGCSLVSPQIAVLKGINQLVIAVEMASAIENSCLVKRAVTQIYNASIPFLLEFKETHFLFQTFITCFEAIKILPPSSIDEALLRVQSRIAFHIVRIASMLREEEASVYILVKQKENRIKLANIPGISDVENSKSPDNAQSQPNPIENNLLDLQSLPEEISLMDYLFTLQHFAQIEPDVLMRAVFPHASASIMDQISFTPLALKKLVNFEENIIQDCGFIDTGESEADIAQPLKSNFQAIFKLCRLCFVACENELFSHSRNLLNKIENVRLCSSTIRALQSMTEKLKEQRILNYHPWYTLPELNARAVDSDNSETVAIELLSLAELSFVRAVSLFDFVVTHSTHPQKLVHRGPFETLQEEIDFHVAQGLPNSSTTVPNPEDAGYGVRIFQKIDDYSESMATVEPLEILLEENADTLDQQASQSDFPQPREENERFQEQSLDQNANRLSVSMAALYHFAASSERARACGAWGKVQNCLIMAWNVICKSWISPTDFSLQLNDCANESSFEKVHDTNVDEIENAKIQPQDQGQNQDQNRGLPSEVRGFDPAPLLRLASVTLDLLGEKREKFQIIQEYTLSMEQLEINNPSHEQPQTVIPRPGSAYLASFASISLPEWMKLQPSFQLPLQWLSRVFRFVLTSMYCARLWTPAVALGIRFNQLTDSCHAECLLPIMIACQKHRCEYALQCVRAQHQLLQTLLREREEEVAKLKAKKRRHRELVAAKEEESEEERKFQEKRQVLQAKLDHLSNIAAKRHHTLVQLFEELNSLKRDKPLGLEALDASRKLRDYFLYGKKSMGETNPPIDSKSVIQAFKRAILTLRQRREVELLYQCLHELGQFHITVGNISDALESWNEGVDSIIGQMDSIPSWRKIFNVVDHRRSFGNIGVESEDMSAIESPKPPTGMLQKYGLFGSLNAIMMLAKAAKHCLFHDKHKQLDYCLMAATMLNSILMTTLSHPQRYWDFRDYRMQEAFPGIDIFQDPNLCTASDLMDSIEYIAIVLIRTGSSLKALPLLSFYEHLSCDISCNLHKTSVARLLKSQSLLEIGAISNAISLLLDLSHGKNWPKSVLSSSKLLISTNDSVFRDDLPLASPENVAVCKTLSESLFPLHVLQGFYSGDADPQSTDPKVKISRVYGIELSIRINLSILRTLAWLGREENGYAANSVQAKNVPAIARWTTPLEENHSYAFMKDEDEEETKVEVETHLDPIWSSNAQSQLLEPVLKNTQELLDWVEQHTLESRAHESKTEEDQKQDEPIWEPQFIDVALNCMLTLADVDAYKSFFSRAIRRIASLMRFYSQHATDIEQADAITSISPSSSLWRLDMSLWLASRVRLANWLLELRRLNEASIQCTQGICEAEKVNDFVYLRELQLIQARISIAKGELDQANEKLESISIESFAADIGGEALVHALLLRGEITIEFSVIQKKSLLTAVENQLKLFAQASDVVQSQMISCDWKGLDRHSGSILASLYIPSSEMLAYIKTKLSQTRLRLASMNTEASEASESKGPPWEDKVIMEIREGLHALLHFPYGRPYLHAELMLLLGRLMRLSCGKYIIKGLSQFEPPVDENETINFPPTHPFQRTYDALQDCIYLAYHHCGHDHTLLHSAMMELVQLLGSGIVRTLEAVHMQAAVGYLSYAYQISQQKHSLLNQTSMLIPPNSTVTIDSSQIPIAVREMICATQGNTSTIFARHLLLHFIELSKQYAVDGYSMSRRLRSTLSRIHSSMKTCQVYRQCCLESIPIVDMTKLPKVITQEVVQPGTVCVQYTIPDPHISYKIKKKSSACAPLTHVRMVYLLGSSNLDNRFPNAVLRFRDVNSNQLGDVCLQLGHAKHALYSNQFRPIHAQQDTESLFWQALCSLQQLFIDSGTNKDDVCMLNTQEKKSVMDREGKMLDGLIASSDCVLQFVKITQSSEGWNGNNLQLCHWLRENLSTLK